MAKSHPRRRMAKKIFTVIFFLAVTALLVVYAQKVDWPAVWKVIRHYDRTALLGAVAGANRGCPFESTVAAVGMMGLAGELAQKRMRELGGGTATFRTCLIDAVSLMTPDQLKGGLQIEGNE